MKKTYIEPVTKREKTVKIIANLTDGESMPTIAGNYITRDYGDGRIDIENFDGEDSWSMLAEGVLEVRHDSYKKGDNMWSEKEFYN